MSMSLVSRLGVSYVYESSTYLPVVGAASSAYIVGVALKTMYSERNSEEKSLSSMEHGKLATYNIINIITLGGLGACFGLARLVNSAYRSINGFVDDVLELNKDLNAWVSEAPEGERKNCLSAKNRILACFICQFSDLNLRNLKLTSLPESIGNLKQLKGLHVGSKKLSSLPECIGNLTQLERLYILESQLSSLPECIGNLTRLTELHVTSRELSSLPESIGNLTQLTGLYVGSKKLSSLPESIGNLTQLTELYVTSRELSSLPESIENLTQLSRLILTKNVGLKELPCSILRLPRNCTVEVSGCGLPQTVLTNLRDASNAPGYDGPVIKCWYKKLQKVN